MTRGFQIWPQNLNRTIFKLILVEKTVENWISPALDHFFGQKGVKYCAIKIWRPDFKSYRHLQPI